MKSTTTSLIAEAVIAVAIIAAVTVLLALHDLSESTAIALYSAAVALVSGTTKSLLALKVPAPAQPVAPAQVPPQV